MKIVEWSENSVTILPEVGGLFTLVFGIFVLIVMVLAMFITIKAFKRISKSRKKINGYTKGTKNFYGNS
ncbi:MAG: hypothetical protein FWC41_09045 [Firmicutes bacterium]|nr:hypothetical protein [Bacillota bacterium]